MALGVLTLALGVPPRPTRADWATFGSTDSLNVGAPQAFAEDWDENVWLGGQDLARYDGLRFINYTDRVDPHLFRVTALMVDRDSILWVGTETGLIQFYHGTWRPPMPEPILASAWVTKLMQDTQGRVWVGTTSGLSRLDKAGWSFVPTGLAGTVVDLLEDADGAIWAATPVGVSTFDGVGWTPHFSNLQSIVGIAQDREGIIWVADASAGLFQFQESSPWVSKRDSNDRPRQVRGILADPDGILWLTTNDGVMTYRPETGTWRSYGVADGLPHQDVVGVARTRDGAMWFWDYFGGFSRFDRSTWQLFGPQELGADFGQALAEEPQTHAIWSGTFYGGMHRYDGTAWKHFQQDKGFPDDRAMSALVDRSGHLWVGTTEHGAGFFPSADSTFRFFTTADGLAGNRVKCIFEDDSAHGNALWFGTDLGLNRLDLADSLWAKMDSTDFGANGEVTSILRERSTEELWIATSAGGIVIQRPGGWTPLRDPHIGSNNVQRLLQASDGDIWVGTASDGVSRRHNGVWTGPYTMTDGLVDNGTFDIKADAHGGIWVGSPGVSRFFRGQWGGYGRSNVVNGAGFLLSATSGDLWMGTVNGVTRHVPDYVPPQTIITSPTHVVSGSRLQTAVFTIGFKEAVDNAKFSIALDPAPPDTAWSSWSLEAFWTESSLSDTPAGQPHVLLVRSMDPIGNIDPTPAVATFEIDATPPTPVIWSPASGAPVHGPTAVVGTTVDPRYFADILWVRPAGASVWTEVEHSSTPLEADTLATWDTTPWPDGPYELRLSVTDSLGLTGSALVSVIVDNQSPEARITSPSRVNARLGGDVYTTNKEVHLYFPPRAFSDDATVSITALANSTVDDTLNNGAVRVLDGYRISWTGGVLQKRARLELSYAGASLGSGTPALYFRKDGGTWGARGGTLDRKEQRISLLLLPSDSIGSYALFAGSNSVQPSGALSDSIWFAPRVFSPSGGYADNKVSIGFVLGRPAPVTVRVYSRSGRLMSEVISGKTLNAGGNLVTWDGRDRSRNIVPDGLYLVTVRALGVTRKQTVAVVR